MKNGGPDNFSSLAQRALQLISALCDERLTDEEAGELESLILSDIEMCRLYVRVMDLNAGLYQYASALGTPTSPDLNLLEDAPFESAEFELNESMILPALQLSDELDAFEASQFTPAPYTAPLPTPEKKFPFLKTGIAALLMLGIGLSIYALHGRTRGDRVTPVPSVAITPDVILPPLPTAVAILDIAAAPVWGDDYLPPIDGNFTAGQSISLKSGAVQFQLPLRNDAQQGQGQLVVEGPAQLDFISRSEIFLHYGKLVAKVPGGGLVIRCPTGVVTDLGTEFGMTVMGRGAAEVAVFEGHVAAAFRSNTTTQPVKDLILSVGQAAIISENAVKMSAEGVIPQRYIASLKSDKVSSLDVADLVSGGDGTTSRRGIAIDSTSGEIGDLHPQGDRFSDGQYHRIQGYPVLDGTFIPDGSIEQMIVDSAGDRIKFSTACNTTHNLIETGGKIRWDDKTGISTKISGVDYSTPGHSIICTHSNNGLTLDLNAVRRLYPGRTITGLHCGVGNSYTNGMFGAVKRNPVAGVFVLVNGKKRFENPKLSNHDGLVPVDVPLTADDRFLTFVATDANTDIDEQWILWTDSKLDLSPPR